MSCSTVVFAARAMVSQVSTLGAAKLTLCGSHVAADGMHSVPDVGKLLQLAGRLFAMKSCVVLMRWPRATDEHVSLLASV